MSSKFFRTPFIVSKEHNILIHSNSRPGSLGLPKFWETVGRLFGRPGFNTQLMLIVICRVKNYLEYPECLSGGKDLHSEVDVLSHKSEYGMGTKRALASYFYLAGIDINKREISGHLGWCAKGENPWSHDAA